MPLAKVLPQCWFDTERCNEGIEALRQYQREYDEDKKAFRQTPRHDWTSHPADSARMLAIAWRSEPRVRQSDAARPLMVGEQNTATLNDVWAQANQPKRGRI